MENRPAPPAHPATCNIISSRVTGVGCQSGAWHPPARVAAWDQNEWNPKPILPHQRSDNKGGRLKKQFPISNNMRNDSRDCIKPVRVTLSPGKATEKVAEGRTDTCPQGHEAPDRCWSQR